jgi:hypothetical protein
MCSHVNLRLEGEYSAAQRVGAVPEVGLIRQMPERRRRRLRPKIFGICLKALN